MMSVVLVFFCAAAWAGEWSAIEATLTAYCPCQVCCGVRAVGLTANGTDVVRQPYGIAADPTRIPYGTRLWIPIGVGYLDNQRPTDEQRQFTVDDTGGIIRRRTRATGRIHLDVRFRQHGNAVRFGIKTSTVWVWMP
jgi:3D (Asp-Asp-Asp) domain-containing protein